MTAKALCFLLEVWLQNRKISRERVIWQTSTTVLEESLWTMNLQRVVVLSPRLLWSEISIDFQCLHNKEKFWMETVQRSKNFNWTLLGKLFPNKSKVKYRGSKIGEFNVTSMIFKTFGLFCQNIDQSQPILRVVLTDQPGCYSIYLKIT